MAAVGSVFAVVAAARGAAARLRLRSIVGAVVVSISRSIVGAAAARGAAARLRLRPIVVLVGLAAARGAAARRVDKLVGECVC